jgi:hypothetical protein
MRSAASSADSHGTTYNGGPVIPNVRIVTVFWGPNVDAVTVARMPGFYSALVNSSYMDWLSEYDSTQLIGRGTFGGTFQITPNSSASGNQLTDDQIGLQLQAQMNHGFLPLADANTLFMIHFPPGVAITDPNGLVSCSDYCAYHGSATHSVKGIGMTYYYAVIPDFNNEGCSCGDRAILDNMTKSASHEVIEAITDPIVSSAWTPEIGDACSYFGGLGDAAYAPLLAPGNYLVQKGWSHFGNRCISKKPVADFAGQDRMSDIAVTGAVSSVTVPEARSNGDGSFTFVNKALGDTSFISWATTAGVKAVGGNFSGAHGADIALLGVPGWTMLPVAYYASEFQELLVRSNSTIGSFATWAGTTGAQPVVGDFDGDGKDDIALTGPQGWGSVPIAFSQGIGSFVTTNKPLAQFPAWAASTGAKAVPGDFNGDGLADIALTGPSGAASIPIAFSNGDGTFHTTNKSVATFPGLAATSGAKIVPGDFDNDGNSDIAVTGAPGWTSITVAFSNGDGSFRVDSHPLASFPAWASTAGVRAVSGDFDGDGDADIALTGPQSWGSVPVAFSNGDGTFHVTNQPTATFPGVAAAVGAIVVGGH